MNREQSNALLKRYYDNHLKIIDLLSNLDPEISLPIFNLVDDNISETIKIVRKLKICDSTCECVQPTGFGLTYRSDKKK